MTIVTQRMRNKGGRATKKVLSIVMTLLIGFSQIGAAPLRLHGKLYTGHAILQYDDGYGRVLL